MTVTWNLKALDDRTGFLEEAERRAFAVPDPQILAAAVLQDDHIQAEGDSLDGTVLYRPGPLPNSHIYPVRGGRYVLLYQRTGSDAQIERVKPTSSNWQAELP